MLSQSAAMRPAISEVSGRSEFSIASSYDAKRAMVAYVLGRSRSRQRRMLIGLGPPAWRRVSANSSPMARTSSYFDVSYSMTCTNSILVPFLDVTGRSKGPAPLRQRQPGRTSVRQRGHADGVGVRDDPARGHGARERLQPAHQPVDGIGRRRREEHAGRGVGGALDQGAQIAPGVGRAPIPVDQAPLPQPFG